MEIRLHLKSAHLSEALSVSNRSPECFSSRPTNPSALRLDVLTVLRAGKEYTIPRKCLLTVMLSFVSYNLL